MNRAAPWLWGLAAALWTVFAPSVPVRAAEPERILSFDSRVVIGADAGLTVTETIEVQASGRDIRHGIVREFPTRHADATGKTARVGFRVLSARRDGRPENFRIADAVNGKKVYLGQKDALLPPGRHTYELTYATDGQIGAFADFDELYWNVTGNGWRLPIDAVRAIILPPPGAAVDNVAAYTGPAGSKGRDCTMNRSPQAVSFATTRPLAPGEGLTVAVSWPKGFVHPPSPLRRMLTSPAFLHAAAGLAAVAVYFLAAWAMAGRDPRRGAIVPLFYPPEGMSAPATRFVRRMGFDDKCLAAAVVEMAVTGGLVIEDQDGGYALSRGKTPFVPGSWQEDVGERLLGPAGGLRLEQTNYRDIQKARTMLRGLLSAAHEGRAFRTNRPLFFLGAALAAGAMVLTALRADDPGLAGMFIPWLAIWSFGVAAMTIRALRALRRARSRPGLTSVVGAFFLCLIAVPFWIGEVLGAAFLSAAISLPAAGCLAAVAVITAVFWHLLKAPTPEGRRVMDAIEGFRLYLSVGERERLDILNPPERTPALFEKYLPYALALDVETQWAAQFATVLERAAAEGYAPGWYVGPGWHSGDFGGFADGLGGGFSSAIASAGTAPGSSSGSGGGGSSGGGGGGGGGGGW